MSPRVDTVVPASYNVRSLAGRLRMIVPAVLTTIVVAAAILIVRTDGAHGRILQPVE